MCSIRFYILLLLIPVTGFSQEKSFYKEVSELTVGKFIYDKNVKIVNDSIDIFIRVNTKGYCYAVDFVSNDKIKFTLSDETIGAKVSKEFEWIYNDSIAVVRLKFDEYQSCGDYLSHKGRNHRYDSYATNINSNSLVYIILNSEYGYAVLAEPGNTNFLTESNVDEGNGKSIPDDWISFKTLEEGINFLKSEEVVSKGNQLKLIQEAIYEKNEALKKFPISSLELPYKFRFGMSEQNVVNNLKELFVTVTKNTIKNSSFTNAKNKGIYKEVEYRIVENSTYLTIQICFLYDKLIKIGYSHWNKNFSRIDDLDLKIQSKLSLIKKDYDSLFDILFPTSQIEGEYQIWSINDSDRLKFEEEFFEEEKSQRKKEIENKIGNKM